LLLTKQNNKNSTNLQAVVLEDHEFPYQAWTRQ
jgi:hypothetical protein